MDEKLDTRINNNEQAIHSANALDLVSVLKYTKILSECTDLPQLLEKLAHLMVQTSAADRLAIVLPDENPDEKNLWSVRVRATTADIQLVSQPLAEVRDLPVELIQSVSHSQKVLTDNDTHSHLTGDRYLKEHPLKSMLCLPMTHQSKTVGVVYLDHHTLDGLFSIARIAELNFLAEHTALLIENVRLRQMVEQKSEIQEELQNTQTQLQTVTENLPGMVFRYLVRADGNMTVLYLSPQVRELYELDIEDVHNNIDLVNARIHPEDIKSVEKKLKEQMVSGADKPGPVRLEYRVILPTQGTRWYRSIRRSTQTKNGDTIWDGIVIDVTEHKLAELAMRDSENKLQRIAENIPGMVYRFEVKADGSRALTYVSSKCQELYEVEPEAAMENVGSILSRIHPEDVDSVKEKIAQSQTQLSHLILEYRVILPKKGQRWITTNCQPFRNEHGDTVWFGVTIDNTHRKQTELHLQRVNEELALATKMKDQFLANMSHELRTPLTAILGSAEGLQHGTFGKVNELQEESAKVITESGLHLLDLINEILDLAKIESGSMELKLSEINITQICESSLQLVNQQAKEKNISLDVQAPFDLPLLQADETRVRQMLVNILDNAVKFTADGGQVTLSLKRISSTNSSDDELLRFSVEDNGVGIEKSKLNHLFKPFVQIQTSINREYEGTGLGLALVKKFAELHSGHVSVSSTEGVGSCFSIDLPFRQKGFVTKHTAAPVNKENEIEPVKPRATDTAPLILLAEDNKHVGKTTIRYLKMKNFRVHWVTDGAAAIEAALKLDPDIILMDVQMPRVDGIQATKKIRKIAALESTPIIALTGLAMHDDEDRCLTAGADHYLSKPYRMAELVDLIEQLQRREVV